MSFIHLDKSVVTFHFKEILEDGHLGGPLTLVGLGALLLGPKLLANLTPAPKTTPTRRPSPYRPGISLTTWVAQQQQTTALPERATLAMAASPHERDRWAA